MILRVGMNTFYLALRVTIDLLAALSPSNVITCKIKDPITLRLLLIAWCAFLSYASDGNNAMA